MIFSLGCNGRGIQHDRPVSVDDQFRMLKESRVFDHFDRMPQPGQEREYLLASQRYGIPIRTGLWTYVAGKDEAVLERNLRLSKEAGGEFHNIMLHARHAQGHVVTDKECVDFYLLAHELGQKLNIDIGFEVHIYMWSEDFRRITPVAQQVRSQGVPFNFILDHSHVLLKLDNPEEQTVSGIRDDVEAGRCVIDPYEEGNVLDEWIAQNMIHWLQIRPVSPNGPKNPWELKEGGTYGRACQYPFAKPVPGEWHLPWHAYRVEPCKEVVRRLLRHHRDTPGSPLRYITTDMIDMADYGGGVKYSLFEQNVAIAEWFRETWAQIQAEPKNVDAMT
ncbi:xylose isomerase [Pusillimonas caeni]|uniref:xylose isomerase n=1 Tax=Pusillimonas caeni TaxID=1348472 RepID=UPI000E5A0AA9|nr:xylose isomerase [Pusillimonas caeni]TFL15626.1 xylose isomerase [Pusillimonas caeni]